MEKAHVTAQQSGQIIYMTIRSWHREAVEAEIRDQLARYHPDGYGTRFEEPQLNDDGWISLGQRFASCD